MKPLIIILCFFLAACGISKGNKNNGAEVLVEDQVEKVSAIVCPSGQRLTIIDSSDSSVEDLEPAIAIISGDDTCANVDSINDTWYDILGQKWNFYALFPSGCIANNSIWQLDSRRNSDGKFDYAYANVSGDKIISLGGNSAIRATYARDHAGIRALRCQ